MVDIAFLQTCNNCELFFLIGRPVLESQDLDALFCARKYFDECPSVPKKLFGSNIFPQKLKDKILFHSF